MPNLRQKLIRLISPESLGNVKLLVLREGRSGLREFTISGQNLYRVVLISLVLLPFLLFLGAQLLLETAHSSRVERLRRDNGQLLSRVNQMETQIVDLERSLGALSELDQDLRSHANIPPIPGEIRQIGTGGGEFYSRNNLDYLLPSEDVSIVELSNRVDVLYQALKLEQLSYEGIRDALKNDLARLKNTPSVRPISIGTFTSGFGYRRDPYGSRKRQMHRGLDISVQPGTKVLSTADGRVILTRFDLNLGLYVKIDHGNGFHTIYGHLRDFAVEQGQRIPRGTLIGWTGNTGRSTAPHLHYEVRHYHQSQNPINYF